MADQIIEAAEDRTDPRRPDFLRFANALRRAVPFEIENRAGEAAYAIADSNLKQLMQARRFAKAPFDVCWFEWLGPSTAFGGNPPPVIAGTHRPIRCGFLLETDRSFQRGMLCWAWSLPQGVEISAMAMSFDWTDNPEPVPDMHRANFAIRGESWESHAHDTIYSKHKAILAGLPPEIAMQEERRWGTVDSPYAQTAWVTIHQLAMRDPTHARAVVQQLYDDIGDEGVFAQALLVCLNSRNLFSCEKPEDVTKVNKARLKRHKQALLSFSKVRLDLSRVAQRKNAAAAGLGGMRAHLVRGHFKIRRSGAFWWSPFVRGDSQLGIVLRSGYTVNDGPGN